MKPSPPVLGEFARALAHSPLFTRGRALWEANQRDWNLPLSKLDKLAVGVFVILDDYAKGSFPPRFDEQEITHEAERNFRFTVPGMTPESVRDAELRKPFWPGAQNRYLSDFTHLSTSLAKLGVRPPSRLLELGCGVGWMAEFLALAKFRVLATSISDDDIRDAQRRARSVEEKGLSVDLRYRVSPMESAGELVADEEPFDAVYVYEALHHAHDWRQTLGASHRCLRPGGWLLICAEPNSLHTFVSYRVAKLSNTHEVGFSRRELVRELGRQGFGRVVSLQKRRGLVFGAHWLAAQR